MPPLVPIDSTSASKTPMTQRQMLEAVKGGSSLLKAQSPLPPTSSSSILNKSNLELPKAISNPIDPLQEMLSEKKQHQPVPGNVKVIRVR